MPAKRKVDPKKAPAPVRTPRPFLSDAQCIAQRRATAEKEEAAVSSGPGENDFFARFEVASAQWDQPYSVEIRSLSHPINSCSCQDYRMNRLGTCKHILRVQQVLAERSKRDYARAKQAESPFYEVFFDVRSFPPTLRLQRPARKSSAAEKALSQYFGDDGASLADASTAFRALQASPAAKLKKVRLTAHADAWLSRDAFVEELQQLRKHFEADVSAGKRSDNPVNQPLYRYQKIGMKHLVFGGRALLADEMGLGKTVQAIAAAQLLQQLGKIKKVLVVCPTSLKAEWEDQLRQFTGREATLLFGLRPKRLQTYTEPHVFLVMNYEQVRNDVDEINRLYAPDLVILDEAQRIKNWPTKTAKTIKRLASPYAFVLTGTPLENRIEELYSLVEFIDPYLFGSIERFQRTFMDTDAEGRIQPKNLPELHRQVSEVMLRRRKADVESNLPQRTDNNFFIPMVKEQWARYEEHASIVAKLVQRARRQALSPEEREKLMVQLGCMRMICDTPYILDQDEKACPKLEELAAILDELLANPDTKVIIFSEWVKMLDLVIAWLGEKGLDYAEHTGRIPQGKRRTEINRFKQDPECRIFLSSESGGAGLNLQVADTVINLDLPWNPAKLEQRIARAWRKHQTRPVRVINLIAEGTIEHAMVDKLADKTALADAVLDGKQMAPRASQTVAFTERIGTLMGIPKEPAPAMESKEPPQRVLDLEARFPDQILGIESKPGTGATVVITRSEQDAALVRKQTSASGVEVVNLSTWKTIQRLAEQGVLEVAPDLENSFAAAGYVAPAQVKPVKRIHRLKARAYWAKHEGEAEAARKLCEVKLFEQVEPHLRGAIEAGVITVAILHAAHPRKTAEQVQAAKCGAHELLVKGMQYWLGTTADLDSGLEILDALVVALLGDE